MPDFAPWSALIAAGVAAALIWIGLVVVLVANRGERDRARDLLRVLPDTLRLLRRLARDRTLPFRLRLGLYGLIAYLVSPIDLIPDALPVIGLVDDVVLVVLTLRSVLRTRTYDEIRSLWPGSDEGLAGLYRLVGLARRASPQR